MLREGAERKELSQFKYVIHHPHLKSGLPIRDGLALPVSFYFMIKTYDVAGWAAFSEDLRIPAAHGKIPEECEQGRYRCPQIRDQEPRPGCRGDHARFDGDRSCKRNPGTGERLPCMNAWRTGCDKQISKGVLGQTMSTDAEGGQYKGDLHNEIRLEIRESDAAQLAATINRSLIRPYVMLNYGVQDNYPVFNMPVPRPEDIPRADKRSRQSLFPWGSR